MAPCVACSSQAAPRSAACRAPASPIGFYFAKLWYYERLYPIVLVTEALERLQSKERAS